MFVPTSINSCLISTDLASSSAAWRFLMYFIIFLMLALIMVYGRTRSVRILCALLLLKFL